MSYKCPKLNEDDEAKMMMKIVINEPNPEVRRHDTTWYDSKDADTLRTVGKEISDNTKETY